MALVLVTRIRSLPEAQIAAGALRSAGIDAVVFDTAFGGVEAPVIESLGGYRIMAPEDQALDARRMLLALRQNPAPTEPDEAGPWSAPSQETARVQRRGMRMLAMALLGAPLVLWLIALIARGRS